MCVPIAQQFRESFGHLGEQSEGMSGNEVGIVHEKYMYIHHTKLLNLL